MAKPEWGTKRNCPKCGTRFYDLGVEDPVVCIDCGSQWTPEPVLKSKQPIPFEEEVKEKEPEEARFRSGRRGARGHRRGRRSGPTTMSTLAATTTLAFRVPNEGDEDDN